MTGWSAGPEATRHLVIDMQRLFAEKTVWHTPSLHAILPAVLRLTHAFAGRTCFARFVVPPDAASAEGQWQHYYLHWDMLVGERHDPALIDIVDPLFPLATQEAVLDKPTYSPFKVPGFAETLRHEGVRHLVFSGIETDVCVLAGVLDAVDLGFAVTVATDAVASSAPAAHEAVLGLVLPRLAQQVRLTTTAEIVAGCSA